MKDKKVPIFHPTKIIKKIIMCDKKIGQSSFQKFIPEICSFQKFFWNEPVFSLFKKIKSKFIPEKRQKSGIRKIFGMNFWNELSRRTLLKRAFFQVHSRIPYFLYRDKLTPKIVILRLI